LVGALYGELSSAEQAQLTTHLESHPADRTALDDLKSVRERFTTSRIFEVQLDPPQAVSALLLQEAARRAPKQVIATDKKESWFDRFVRSFIAHPAMAAAASLVLVIGVAGTIYLKGGGDSQPRVDQKLEDTTVATAPGAAAWGSATMGQGNAHGAALGLDQGAAQSAAPAIVAGDKAGAIGAKNDSVVADLADPQQELSRARAQRELAFADDAKHDVAISKHASPPQATKPAAPKGRYVEIPNASPQPKDLDEEQQDRSGKDSVATKDFKKEAPRGAVAGGGAATGATVTATTEAGPSAPPVAANSSSE
jgi:hypothetical protein